MKIKNHLKGSNLYQTLIDMREKKSINIAKFKTFLSLTFIIQMKKSITSTILKMIFPQIKALAGFFKDHSIFISKKENT